MPGMDGYQACERIISFYNEARLGYYLSERGGEPADISSFPELPLIFACSAQIDARVQKRTRESGFLACYEQISYNLISELFLSGLI
mmetsp:Transcript_16196/g.27412  ORF Transcript_16196/g.27412 Transcript_16196/m.27412 type:complete len:87 (-) Transcript_16196:24-284(-)